MLSFDVLKFDSNKPGDAGKQQELTMYAALLSH
jgi:hypothetical protein